MRTTSVSTEATGGAWSTTEQHISPMNGLITHAVERFCAERGPDGLEISRISVDILGMLGMDPFEVAVSVVRPGRTIELLEAVVTSAGPTAHRRVAVPQPGLDDPSAASRPAGTWLGLDTTVVFGPAGHGVTSSVLARRVRKHFGYAQPRTLT